ncbi:helix-turn-helix domain-containing protein [Streptomyces sp. NPDC056910]|uniref:helix-turn-helix domain-containing protein n=1 Tax=Streptomyces sp. NPDC056910 TaxID=3345964 RepID=UPI0036A77798
MASPPASRPPYAAARWAVRLRDQGISAQDIADRAGLSVTQVRRVLRVPEQGQVARDIARTTADAVLGIPLPPRGEPGAPGLTGSARVPAGLPPHSPCAWVSTPARSLRPARNASASVSIWQCGSAACIAN